MYEDQAFLSKAYLIANVYFDERVWIDYRLHDNSAMHQQLAAGRYDEIRKYFLEWFAAYLRNNRVRHALRVRIAVQRAYFYYGSSSLSSSARKAKRAWNKHARRWSRLELCINTASTELEKNRPFSATGIAAGHSRTSASGSSVRTSIVALGNRHCSRSTAD